MTLVLICLGSNLAPSRNLRAGLEALCELVDVQALSPIYHTLPVGPQGQPPFLNAAVLADVAWPPERLKSELLRIEAALGRRRSADRYAPRPLDLDLAAYGDQVLEVGGRHIPDPEIALRAHIARPLADVAPGWVHPELGRSLAAIAADLDDSGLSLAPDETQQMQQCLHRELDQPRAIKRTWVTRL
jgi:2-amino-4-hydroxy-6-hydroxymethyldihydropteridine diphosphokinase